MNDGTKDLADLEQLLSMALAEAIAPVELPPALRASLRNRVLQHAQATATHRTITFRLKPGGEIPAHYHPFEEETYVLEGQIECGEEILRAGDCHFAAPGSFHETIHSQGGAVLLIRYQTPETAGA